MIFVFRIQKDRNTLTEQSVSLYEESLHGIALRIDLNRCNLQNFPVGASPNPPRGIYILHILLHFCTDRPNFAAPMISEIQLLHFFSTTYFRIHWSPHWHYQILQLEKVQCSAEKWFLLSQQHDYHAWEFTIKFRRHTGYVLQSITWSTIIIYPTTQPVFHCSIC